MASAALTGRGALMDAKRRSAEAMLGALPLPAEGEAGWAREARAAARARFLDLGAPIKRDEYWKYTDPETLTAAAPAAAPAAAEAEAPLAEDVCRLVFVDGAFRADLSDAPSVAGLEIATLADAMAADIHWARDLYGRHEAAAQARVPRPIAALNSAGATQGIAIRASAAGERPVLIEYRQSGAEADALVHHLIRVEAGASLTLLEDGAGAARLNTVIEAEIADGGALHHIRAQGRDHGRAQATALFARIGTGSAVKSFSLAANTRYTRNDTVVEVAGDNAIAHIAGAAIGAGPIIHDDTIFVTHDAEGCESRQVFKKVLREGATGVFQGKILVQPGAQKTDGYQLSQALILDERSQFNAKPELEIYADDVKCSHGSTTGSLDPDALFYLRARGITEDEARDLLVIAFLEEAVEEIEDEGIAEQIRARIEDWMAAHRG